MKRLCVYYRGAAKWQGKPVEWIVCKECQRKIRQGRIIVPAPTFGGLLRVVPASKIRPAA